MFPELFKIGGITLHTYGLFIAIGIILGLYVVKRDGERKGINGDKLVDILFWAIFAGIVGSRIFYVIYFPAEFKNNLLEIVKVWKGGLVFQGGALFGGIVLVYLLKKSHIPIVKALDSVALGVPLAHFFGRLGCFSAGCCYGAVCDLPWAVRFTHPKTLAPPHLPLHPTQLYEAFLNLILFLMLFAIKKRVKKEGSIFGFYLVGYGAIRFFVEFFRGDPRDIWLNLSTAQWISIFFIVLGLIFIFVRKDKKLSLKEK